MSKQTFNSQASSPGTPASGKVNQWSSTVNKRFWYTDENGVSGPIGIPYTTYYVDDYGVTPANSAATNVTNLNTLLQSTAPDKSKIQFGAGTYQFNAGLTTLTKDFAFAGIRGMTTIAITAAMGSNTPFLKLSNTGFYTSFRDLNFVNFSAQSSNYVIQCQNNANTEFLDCFFTGAANWSGVLDFSGTNSGNGAVLKNVYIANWAAKAINVSSPLDTMYIEDLEIVGTGVAGSIGFYCDNGGAVLMSGCQIINADINVELNPANGNTVSAVFATNCFFDQGKTNCLLVTGVGTGTVARCHFVACWFTIAGTGSSSGAGTNTKCIQINTTGTGIHSGIEFDSSWIMNATTGSTGTIEGILATSVQDFSVTGCQLAGWTNDIQITPASTATCSPLIMGNTMAAAGLIAASTTNIILNAGSFAYGAINIQNNTLNGTTKLTDNSGSGTGTAATNQKAIAGNTGLLVAPVANYTANVIPITTVTNFDTRGGWFIPAGTRACSGRITAYLTNTATIQTPTFTVKFGTANSNADATVFTPPGLTAGTAVVGSAIIQLEWELLSSTTMLFKWAFTNGNNGATGLAATASFQIASSAPVTVATSSNSWLGIYIADTVANIITVRSVKYEVLSQ